MDLSFNCQISVKRIVPHSDHFLFGTIPPPSPKDTSGRIVLFHLKPRVELFLFDQRTYFHVKLVAASSKESYGLRHHQWEQKMTVSRFGRVLLLRTIPFWLGHRRTVLLEANSSFCFQDVPNLRDRIIIRSKWYPWSW